MHLLFCLFSAPSFAASSDDRVTAVAVLELAEGPRSDEFDGLGVGLSSLISTDLEEVNGIALVEPQRLREVQAEIQLGREGWLDPETATRAGRMVGADYLLVGRYNVIKDMLSIDVRLLDVAKGVVVEGEVAVGRADDFSAVEKRIVLGILEDLKIVVDAKTARKLTAQVPTRSFDALYAWSVGRREEDRGNLETARAAYRAALAKDPQFDAAITSLDQVAALAESARAAAAQRADTTRTGMAARVLAATTDPRARTATTWTATEIAGLPARWAILLEQGDACRRYSEMKAFLDAFEWRPQNAVQNRFAAFSGFATAVQQEAERVGFLPWVPSQPHPDRAVRLPLARREVELFRDTPSFLLHTLVTLDDESDAGLATSLLSCRGSRGAVAELDPIERGLVHRGVLEAPTGRGMMLAEALVVLRGWFEADGGVVAPSTRARLVDLRNGRAELDKPVIADLIARIERHAEAQARWRQAPLGLEPSTVRSRLQALANGTAPFTHERAWCGTERERSWRADARRVLAQWEDDDRAAHRPDAAVEAGGRIVRVAADMGCFDGAPARVSTWAETRQFIQGALGRQMPTATGLAQCQAKDEAVVQMLAGPGDSDPHVVAEALDALYVAVQERCLLEP